MHRQSSGEGGSVSSGHSGGGSAYTMFKKDALPHQSNFMSIAETLKSAPPQAQSVMNMTQKYGHLEKIQEEKVSEEAKSRQSKRSKKGSRNKENNNENNNESSFSKHSKRSEYSNRAEKKRTFHSLMKESGGYGIGNNNFLGSKLGRTSFLNMGGSRSDFNY
jgi:hypothetical protein